MKIRRKTGGGREKREQKEGRGYVALIEIGSIIGQV